MNLLDVQNRMFVARAGYQVAYIAMGISSLPTASDGGLRHTDGSPYNFEDIASAISMPLVTAKWVKSAFEEHYERMGLVEQRGDTWFVLAKVPKEKTPPAKKTPAPAI